MEAERRRLRSGTGCPTDQWGPVGGDMPGSEGADARRQPGESGNQDAELVLSAPRGDTPCKERWYTRGYMPHHDTESAIQSITLRLADSLPQERLRQLAEELARFPPERQDAARRQRIEHWLGAGAGSCALRHAPLAKVMTAGLLRGDGDRYRLLAWCIMPNHVHVMIAPGAPLAKIVQSWKSYTGRWALAHNDELGLGVPGHRLWKREFWDRYIRNQEHFVNALNYIHNNPVKAHLCQHPRGWPWSSAYSTS